MRKVSNWGNYPVVEGKMKAFREQEVQDDSSWIPRGMGRCYGDASLGQLMLSNLKLNRMLSFDPQSGLLECESGVTFDDLLQVFLPKGWFPPVTPGTKYVTMGGALAADVHGKNHHVEGAISRYIRSFKLLTPEGEMLTCSRERHSDIFWATAGGMGLTGFVKSLVIQLKPVESSYISMQSVKAANLDEILELFDEFERATYSVAWIDCMASGKKMGRSILMKGEHISKVDFPDKLKKHPLEVLHKQNLNVPVYFPSFTLNPLTVRAFNFFYYHKQLAGIRQNITTYDSFFYPLDAIHNWNRIYGKKGFTQYQLVIPKSNGQKGLQQILKRISQSGLGSFLAVLKLMGHDESQGMLSFPMEGYTLALDFPVSRKLFPFLDELDQMVVDLGGRIYLAKDARLSAQMLAPMYPRLDEFRQVLERTGSKGRLSSVQAKRLKIIPN